ncbi:hypothetical protein FRB96_007897 [Tulasnella sp. 330]|nr:hypothetical protein FRB96_007897 [Tulasnella sp. 330]KAG8874527.1 hypothetical protein FRB97_005852 [Tulasnella sp. 331]KAG8874696.1 hypothetical protein FRB98_008299 [Tulasnella sp. 332]
MPPYIANEVLEQFMVNAYGLSELSDEAWESCGQLIPRKNPAKFRLFAAFASASHRHRSVALRAWFTVYFPHPGDDEDPMNVMARYALHTCVRHLFLDASFDLRAASQYRCLRSLSYVPGSNLDWISDIPPRIRGLEIRPLSEGTQIKVALLSSIVRAIPRLERLRVADSAEFFDPPHSDSVEDLQAAHLTALTPLTQLRHLSLGVNLTRTSPEPFQRISDSDSRAENENAFSLSLARTLPHLQSVEFQRKSCSSPSSGLWEKAVFTILKKQPHPSTTLEPTGRQTTTMTTGATAEKITMNKKYMSKTNECTSWQRCFFSGPSGVYSWTVK